MLDDEARYFSVALREEMATRGRGIQKELARRSGISTGLICDLKKGRTGSSPEKREALVKALGGQCYEDFIAKGKELEKSRLRSSNGFSSLDREGGDETSRRLILNLRRRVRIFRRKTNVLTQKLIAVQEKHISAQEENMRLQREMLNLQRAGRVDEAMGDPIGGAVRTAQIAEVK